MSELKKVEFATLKDHRYILRGFTSLDGRKLSNEEFNINNFAVAPDGCTFVFQKLD